VTALREHRKAQAAERLAAVAWVDPGLVFTTHVGTALEPRNVNRAWEDLCARAGVRRVRLHDLRHSAATFMLAAGADLKVIQATLRHSRLSTTSDVYAHVLADVQRQAAERMDGVLRQLGAD
jgi:integrase